MIHNIPDDRIIYLSVPETLGGVVGDFSIDPELPIPVEVPEGQDSFDVANLSWEMMVAGMLRVVEADPTGPRSDYYRAFAQAVKPELLSELTEAGVMKAKDGQLEVAESIFATLRAVFPENAVVALNQALVLEARADSLARSGDEDQAELYADKAFGAYKVVLRAEPPLPDAFFNVAFFHMKQKNFEKAREAFEGYLEVGKDGVKREKATAIVKDIRDRELDDQALKEAYDLVRMGEEEKGIARAKDFLERRPEVWNGWFILGWGLRRLERWADAEACFRKTLEFGGTNADSLNELAICLMEKGDLKGARKELELALRHAGDDARIVSNMGVVSLKEGNVAEAASFFRAALEMEPDDPMAKSLLQSIEG